MNYARTLTRTKAFRPGSERQSTQPGSLDERRYKGPSSSTDARPKTPFRGRHTPSSSTSPTSIDSDQDNYSGDTEMEDPKLDWPDSGDDCGYEGSPQARMKLQRLEYLDKCDQQRLQRISDSVWRRAKIFAGQNPDETEPEDEGSEDEELIDNYLEEEERLSRLHCINQFVPVPIGKQKGILTAALERIK